MWWYIGDLINLRWVSPLACVSCVLIGCRRNSMSSASAAVSLKAPAMIKAARFWIDSSLLIFSLSLVEVWFALNGVYHTLLPKRICGLIASRYSLRMSSSLKFHVDPAMACRHLSFFTAVASICRMWGMKVHSVSRWISRTLIDSSETILISSMVKGKVTSCLRFLVKWCSENFGGENTEACLFAHFFAVFIYLFPFYVSRTSSGAWRQSLSLNPRPRDCGSPVSSRG